MSDSASDNKKNKKILPYTPKPKPFHIDNPFQDRGLWCFFLSADDEVLEFVSSLNCILQPSMGSLFHRRSLRGRVMFAINPRYDHEEVWLWITELLESEAQKVELNTSWEEAIDEAQTSESDNGTS